MNDKQDYLFADFPEFKVTEETRKDVIENPQKYSGCDIRIRMGKFYTDEEWDKRSKEMSLVKLPSDKKLILKK